MNETLDVEFESQFLDHPLFRMTPQTFALEIEKLVKNEQMDYLEAVTKLCDDLDMDYTAVPKLLTQTMKDKIEMAATARNYKL